MARLLKESDIKPSLKLATSSTKELVIAGVNGDEDFPELLAKYTWTGTRDYNMALIIVAFYTYCMKSSDPDIKKFGILANLVGSKSNKLFQYLKKGNGKKVKDCMDQYFRDVMDKVLKIALPDPDDENERKNEDKRKKIIENFIKYAGKITYWKGNGTAIELLIDKMQIKQEKMINAELIKNNKLLSLENEKLKEIYAKKRNNFAVKFGGIKWTDTSWGAYVVTDQTVVETVMKFCAYCVEFNEKIKGETDECMKINSFVEDKKLFYGVLDSLKNRNNRDIKSNISNEKFKEALNVVLSFKFNKLKCQDIINSFIERANAVGALLISGKFDANKLSEKYGNIQRAYEKAKSEKLVLQPEVCQAIEENLNKFVDAYMVSNKDMGCISICFFNLKIMLEENLHVSYYGEWLEMILNKYRAKLVEKGLKESAVEALYENFIKETAEKADGNLYFSCFLNGTKKSVVVNDQEEFEIFKALGITAIPRSIKYTYVPNKNVESKIQMFTIDRDSIPKLIKGYIADVETIKRLIKESFFKKGENEFTLNQLLVCILGEERYKNTNSLLRRAIQAAINTAFKPAKLSISLNLFGDAIYNIRISTQ